MVGVVKLFFEEVEVQELQIVMFITILHKTADTEQERLNGNEDPKLTKKDISKISLMTI